MVASLETDHFKSKSRIPNEMLYCWKLLEKKFNRVTKCIAQMTHQQNTAYKKQSGVHMLDSQKKQ